MERHFARPRLVVSRCLEFDACRYDGSRIPSPLVAALRPLADLVPVCPEVEIGLGIPRESVRIVRTDCGDHLVQPATERDVTHEMQAFTTGFLDRLPPLDGFLLKGGSPTSGPSGVRVYPSAGRSAPIGRSAGFFAREVLRRFPFLPVEDELRLGNPRVRDAFLAAVFALAAFRPVESAHDIEALARFHAENKLYLGACHRELSREMGRLVAARAHTPTEELFVRYREMLGGALARAPRHTANVDVLFHAMGHFRGSVSDEERAHCLRLIERYRAGHAYLAEPRDLLRSWAIRFNEPGLVAQTFFAPYPWELALLPPETTGRGRDLWRNRQAPADED